MGYANETEKTTWLATFRVSVFYTISSIAVVGAIGNAFVFVWLLRFSRRRPGLNPAAALLCMCAADFVCLINLICFTVLSGSFLPNPAVSSFAKHLFCKTTIFAIHTASAFSVWCWMVLSGLRFTAIFAPVFYTKHQSLLLPTPILRAVLLVCALLEMWLLYVTVYDKRHKDCAHDQSIRPTVLRAGFTFEIIVHFFLPSSLTVAMDMAVWLKPQQRMSLSGHAQSMNSIAREKRDVRMVNSLRRYLLLTSLDLLMSAPNTVIRLLLTHGLYQASTATGEIFSGVGHVLWYSQFSVNFLYIWVLVAVNSDARNTSCTLHQRSHTEGVQPANSHTIGEHRTATSLPPYGYECDASNALLSQHMHQCDMPHGKSDACVSNGGDNDDSDVFYSSVMQVVTFHRNNSSAGLSYSSGGIYRSCEAGSSP